MIPWVGVVWVGGRGDGLDRCRSSLVGPPGSPLGARRPLGLAVVPCGCVRGTAICTTLSDRGGARAARGGPCVVARVIWRARAAASTRDARIAAALQPHDHATPPILPQYCIQEQQSLRGITAHGRSYRQAGGLTTSEAAGLSECRARRFSSSILILVGSSVAPRGRGGDLRPPACRSPADAASWPAWATIVRQVCG